MSTSLTTSVLAKRWRVSERRTRQLLGELEALGFRLEPDIYGARRCPLALAEAVQAARAEGRELATLLELEGLRHLLPRNGDGGDPLAALIEAQAELAILRAAVAELARAVEGVPAARRVHWQAVGLPEPRRAL
jgi:hypothetical protein